MRESFYRKNINLETGIGNIFYKSWSGFGQCDGFVKAVWFDVFPPNVAIFMIA